VTKSQKDQLIKYLCDSAEVWERITLDNFQPLEVHACEDIVAELRTYNDE
jgi:hypothetical protein